MLLVFASSASAEVGYAVVKKIQGSVQYTSAIGQGDLKVGQVLTAGARISTQANSFVDLNLGVNGDALRVEESSTVTLTELTFRRLRRDTAVVKTEMNVTRGHVVANVVKKLSRASRYRIRTPNGVAGIRGTCVQAGVTGVLAVIGTVQFTTVNGQVSLVIGGFVMSAGSNQPLKAATVQTQGVASSATASTANTGTAAMVQATVQQFAQAIASQAASNAPNTQQATQVAAQTAAAVVAALTQAIQQAAQTAPPEIQQQVQQAAQAVQQQVVATTMTAAAGAAATATVAVATAQGATPQQAQQQAQQSAQNAAQSAGQAAVNSAPAGQQQQAAQQAAQVQQTVAAVTQNTIVAVQQTLASGGTVDQAVNQGSESTPTVTVDTNNPGAAPTVTPTGTGQTGTTTGTQQAGTVTTITDTVIDTTPTEPVITGITGGNKGGGTQ